MRFDCQKIKNIIKEEISAYLIDYAEYEEIYYVLEENAMYITGLFIKESALEDVKRILNDKLNFLFKNKDGLYVEITHKTVDSEHFKISASCCDKLYRSNDDKFCGICSKKLDTILSDKSYSLTVKLHNSESKERHEALCKINELCKIELSVDDALHCNALYYRHEIRLYGYSYDAADFEKYEMVYEQILNIVNNCVSMELCYDNYRANVEKRYKCSKKPKEHRVSMDNSYCTKCGAELEPYEWHTLICRVDIV